MEQSKPDWFKWIDEDDKESINAKEFDVNEIWKDGSSVSSFFCFFFLFLLIFSKEVSLETV